MGQVASHSKKDNRQNPFQKDAASLFTKLMQSVFYLILLLYICTIAMSCFVKTSHSNLVTTRSFAVKLSAYNRRALFWSYMFSEVSPQIQTYKGTDVISEALTAK